MSILIFASSRCFFLFLGTTGKRALDSSYNLTYVSRGHQSNGREQFEPPKQIDTNRNWDMLRQYLDSIDSVLEELKPIVDKIAIQNTIIVMVCNVSIH